MIHFCKLSRVWIYFVIILSFLMDENYSIRWLGISRYTRPENQELERFSPLECRFNNLNHGLQKRQTKFCLSLQHSYAMHGVLRASKAAVFYCMKTFQDRRWNCSSAERLPYIGKDLESGKKLIWFHGYIFQSGTQEQAVVHAFSSASLLFEIARRCAQNKMAHCSCGTSNPTANQEITQEKLLFAGCPDNVEIGLEYVRKFTGYHKLGRKKSKEKPRKEKFSFYVAEKRAKMQKKLKKIQRLNGHNYEAGLRIQLDNQKIHCKCHGVSGGCNQRICYRQVRRLDDDVLLNVLRKQYLSAKYVDILSDDSLVAADPFGGSEERPKPISQTDLVFTEHSPDFCEPDPTTGSVGTHGRVCKTENTSKTSTEHCTNMCCGRGHRTVLEQKRTKCGCFIDDKFKIQCDDCYSNVKTFYCL
uniref:Protein Wnt n=1 Tax=Schmidtea mediterranea TaxID=79327 RepID=C3U5B2_SCHMD|nr:Wnt11-2 [Schmidtea mediterranea]